MLHCIHPALVLQVHCLARFHFFLVFAGIQTNSEDGIRTGRGELCGYAVQRMPSMGGGVRTEDQEKRRSSRGRAEGHPDFYFIAQGLFLGHYGPCNL